MKSRTYWKIQAKIALVKRDCVSTATPSEGEEMKPSKFPRGWDEDRVRRVLAHYEKQNEDEAVAEDEASFDDAKQTVMEVPRALVPVIRELIAKRGAAASRTSRSRRRPKTGRA